MHIFIFSRFDQHVKKNKKKPSVLVFANDGESDPKRPPAGYNNKLFHGGKTRNTSSTVTTFTPEMNRPASVKVGVTDVLVWLDDTGKRWAQQSILSHPAFNRPLLPLDTRLVTKPTHVPHCQILKRLVSKITRILTVKLYVCAAYKKVACFIIFTLRSEGKAEIKRWKLCKLDYKCCLSKLSSTNATFCESRAIIQIF